MAGGKPQLVMGRDQLHDLPEVMLPDGYSLRHYQLGDAPIWEDLVAAAFDSEADKHRFDDVLRNDPAFREQRVLFVTHNNQPVATASAWYKPRYRSHVGNLHFVAVRPDHLGKRLGYWVSLAAMQQLAKEGFKRVTLETDDFRTPAIKTYLRLGFAPVLVHENQIERWREVLRGVDATGELEREFVSRLGEYRNRAEELLQK